MLFTHDAIIVTARKALVKGKEIDPTKEAQDRALSMFPERMVSSIVTSPINGFSSFMIGPDGEDERDDESFKYEDLYIRYCLWLAKHPYIHTWQRVKYGMGNEGD